MQIGDNVYYQNPYDKIVDKCTIIDIRTGYFNGDDAYHLIGKDVNVMTRRHNVLLTDTCK